MFNILEEGAFGGPQRRAVVVAKELRSLGVATILVFPVDSPVTREACRQHDCVYEEVRMRPLSRGWPALRYVIGFPAELARLTRLLATRRPDVVHVSGGSFSVKGALAARLANVPFVWHLNDTYSPRAVRSLFRLAVRAAPPAVAAYAAPAVRDYYGGDLPAGTSEAILPAPFRSELIHAVRGAGPSPFVRPGRNEDAFDVLTVANVNPVKGIDTAIRSLEILGRRTADRCRLHILGGTKSTQTTYELELKQLAEDLDVEVFFHGHVDAVGPWLQHCDVYLCASRSEASPLAVWDAAAASVPIVSTDVGDVGRMLGETVHLCKVETPSEIADALESVRSDRSAAEQLGAEARARISNQAGLPTVARLTREAYVTALLVGGPQESGPEGSQHVGASGA